MSVHRISARYFFSLLLPLASLIAGTISIARLTEPVSAQTTAPSWTCARRAENIGGCAGKSPTVRQRHHRLPLEVSAVVGALVSRELITRLVAASTLARRVARTPS